MKIWNLERFKNNTAVIMENGEKVSYRQLEAYCCECSSHIRLRSLVFILCKNAIGALIGYISVLNFGSTPLMLSEDIDREQLQIFLRLYKPDFLWVPENTVSEFEGEVVFRMFGFALIQTKNERVFPLLDELALLLTTSGSTGSPKFVRLSYTNIKANTESIVEYLNLDSTEKPITTLPMNYTYGLSIINTHLYVGAGIILTEKTLIQREFWQQLMEHGATSFGGVPYTYEVLEKLKFFRRKLPALKTMTQAGGKIAPELHRKFAEYALNSGKKFVVMYGQTEATARMAYLPSERSLEKCGSMGIPIPGGKFLLKDIDGKEIKAPETVGELVYMGANVMLGYAERGEDLIEGDQQNGQLATGDLAKYDEDGFYTIVGRKKRFLKIYGNRVNLDETEGLIKSHFEGLDCACSGKDDLMSIFITDGAKIAEVRRFISEKSRLNPAAFKVVCIKTIPKNESGKTLYKELESAG